MPENEVDLNVEFYQPLLILDFSVYDFSLLDFSVFDFAVFDFSVCDFFILDFSGFDFWVFDRIDGTFRSHHRFSNLARQYM